jgi:hypothetical protein
MASQNIKDMANRIKAERLALFGAMASILLGEGFKMEEWLEHANDTIQFGIVKGEPTVLATTTSFADTEIVIPGADDRTRLVCGVALIVDAGIAEARVPAEVLVQLNRFATIEWKKRIGKTKPEAFRAYSLGLNDGLVLSPGYGHAEGGDAEVEAAMLAASELPLMEYMAPRGVDQAMLRAIDVIEEGKKLVGEFRGLTNATVAASHSGVNVTPFALVADAIR